MPLHNHASPARIGVLINNLGTPSAPDRASVRAFLKEFLWDPRVVEMSRPAWWLVLNGIILNTRPQRSARAYAKVWTEEGSPLAVITMQQVEALRQRFDSNEIVVEPAMRYGSPSIKDGLTKLHAAGATRILVLPLYPQYSATTTASTFDAVTAELREWRWLPEMRFVNHYHDHPDYITTLTHSVRNFQERHGRAEKLLLSFHGIPQEYFHKGDPYYCECQKTARLLGESLGLAEDEMLVSFQSRLGPRQWLEPYTDKTLEQLAKSGTRSVQVVCPGFSVDCLETIEEIGMENRDVFLENGGERYEYIPCLNDLPGHIDFLQTLVEQHTQGWAAQREDPALTQQRAAALGAESQGAT